METNEKSFEEKFEERLIDEKGHNYIKRSPENYDKDLCLDAELLLLFVKTTQPNEWKKIEDQYGNDTENQFLKRIFTDISRRSVIDVLRNGIKDRGAKFDFVIFPPANNLNPEHAELYKQNKFSVIRQLKWKHDRELSVDMTLFINGIPFSTLELKNYFTGQDYTNALKQYQYDRDPKDELFKRCFVHFAVDNDVVYFTSKLKGKKTLFLPFNKDIRNPEDPRGFKVSYLYEDILAPKSVLDIIANFVQLMTIKDEKTSKILDEYLLFPRFHQLTTVRQLDDAVKTHKAGKNYLIEHSAGSGKTYTIAWLAHQLTKAFNEDNERIYDSIIVISDRRVIDKQLKEAVKQFEKKPGVVETSESSDDLKKYLAAGVNIIVTTAQKFSFVVKKMEELSGQNFAVIIDEAHSSQGGETSHSINKTLSYNSLNEAAEAEESEEEKTLIDNLAESEMKTRGPLPNVSFFAFTATPKQQTLEMFGEKQQDGSFRAFSLYSMKQAIGEGFIIDVLQNYTTYKTYFKLLKKIEEDPHFDKKKVIPILHRFVDLHGDSISEKVSIILDHFDKSAKYKIGGQSKAMVVTKSRLHAVRYKNEIDKQLRQRKAGYKALVAFTGIVKDNGFEFTESSMNGFSESKTKEEFNSEDFRILVVANKYQTGFDQPLLYAMYVDKKLNGINAVQTLSRLNRKRPLKDDTVVLDFVNQADEIQKAFQIYYDTVILSEGTDPNILYDLQRKIEDRAIIHPEDIEKFNFAFVKSTNQSDLHQALESSIQRYLTLSKDEKLKFRDLVKKYVKIFAFVTQLISFTDAELEKLYQYCRFLVKKLPIDKESMPKEVLEAVEIESYEIKQSFGGDIGLNSGEAGIEYPNLEKEPGAQDEEKEPLSEIIGYINDLFGIELSEHDKEKIKEITNEIQNNETFDLSRKANNPSDNLKLLYEKVFEDVFMDTYEKDFNFFQKINNNPEAKKTLRERLFGAIMRNKV